MTLWRRLVTLYVFPPVQNRDMKINFIIDLISLYKMPKTHGKHWIIVNYSVSGSDSKDSACGAGDLGLIPGLKRSSGGGYGNPLQFFCLENPHGQRSLAGCSPWDHKELDMTEWLSTCACGHGDFLFKSYITEQILLMLFPWFHGPMNGFLPALPSSEVISAMFSPWSLAGFNSAY